MTHTAEDIERIAKGLTKAQREGLNTLPLPGWTPHRVFVGCGRTVSYSSTWRKSANHWQALVALKSQEIVESKDSRGETLWRLTTPFGLAVRAHLIAQEGGK